MSEAFRLLMISAMYENGGNTTQRLLDGHPEVFSYPFESQPGTKYVQDHLSSLFPVKYRWPVFPLSNTVEDDYEAIIDEECKVRIKTPQSSKFRETPLQLDDRERRATFVEIMRGRPRTRGNLVAAFFEATARAWKDAQRSGRESVYVGYSPIIGVDADKILADLPQAHLLNVIRNPWSAYADTKKRALPLSMAHYMTGWNVHQLAALNFGARFPDRVHNVRYEQIVADPMGTLSAMLAKVGVGASPTLARPSWNGRVLEQVHPWGTIRVPTVEVNRATANELATTEREQIRLWAHPLLAPLGYLEA